MPYWEKRAVSNGPFKGPPVGPPDGRKAKVSPAAIPTDKTTPTATRLFLAARFAPANTRLP
jgi:hypothetical protein